MTSPSAFRTASPDGLDDGTVALRDHIKLLTGYPFKSEFYTEQPDGVRLVRGDNVVQGQLRWDNVKRWPLNRIDEASGYELREGDVVLAMDRPWIEAGLKYARIGSDDVPSLLVQRVSCLRAKDGLDQGYLFYLIGSHRFTDHVLSIQTGTAVPHISGPQILQFRYRPLPIDRQRAIAAVLGSLDDKIEQNRRTARALERLARAIFRAWFVDFEPVKAKAGGATSFPSMPQPIFDALPTTFTDSELGPVPEGWEVIDLKSIIALEYGKALKAESRLPGDVPVYGSNGQVGHHSVALVNQPGIVVGRKGNPGTVHWAPAPFFPIDTTFYVVTRSVEYPLRWVFFAMELADLARLSMDSAVPGLNREAALSHTLVLPNAQLAQAFCRSVDDYLLLAETATHESLTLAALRDYLLPQLLSGQVPVEVGDA